MLLKRMILLLVLFGSCRLQAQQYDVCIYGSTSAGVIAAYAAAKQHKKVILVEPASHLGGLSSGGLGYTDIGNKYVVTGLARDVYRRLGTHYGRFESWVFEPHVAEALFNEYISRAGVPVLFHYRIVSAVKQDAVLRSITLEDANSPGASTHKTITAKMFIDCSYEGDLMAKAKVSYTTGREDNGQYGETWNGMQRLDKHQFPDGVDPYKIKGDTTSGLLWGVSRNRPLPDGTGNRMVQTYNYRLCLTNEKANKIDITKPDDYDAGTYELLLRYLEKRQPKNLNDAVLSIALMPNGKTDINNNGPFSTDMIGANYNYPNGDYSTRKQILDSMTSYTKGLLYFLGHDEWVPPHLRNEMLQWGYPKDEFTDNNHFTPQAYIRESRRMIGSYVMTEHNCEGRESVTDGIGMAAYTMDSHNCERLIVNGMVKNEGDVQKGGFGPYPVSYRAIVPKEKECVNLLVPVCLSASHIAYGSIRMEPVFMVLAESASAAACMAIDARKPVQQIDVRQLQQELAVNPLMDGSPPEILVDDNDSLHTAITGSWKRQTTGGYGPGWLTATPKANGTVTYTPHITISGNYNVYAYIPQTDSSASQLHYLLRNGTITKEITITPQIGIEGQASGEWALLGRFTLPKGNQTSITIHTANVDGIVTADAVLLVPVKR